MRRARSASHARREGRDSRSALARVFLRSPEKRKKKNNNNNNACSAG